jgi:ribonuclease P protein component
MPVAAPLAGAQAAAPDAPERAAAPSPVLIENVRFGITVSKRQARRAVARNMVKRVVRESARRAAPLLCAAAGGASAEVLFRLKSPLPDASAATWSMIKGQVRREADSLMEQLRGQLLQQRQVLAQSGNGVDARATRSAGTPR